MARAKKVEENENINTEETKTNKETVNKLYLMTYKKMIM